MNTQSSMNESAILSESHLEISLEEYCELEDQLLQAAFAKVAIGIVLYATNYDLDKAFFTLSKEKSKIASDETPWAWEFLSVGLR